ncbi:hypothetical protein ACLB2K_061003 [Fragaria x ananassa]
MDETDREMKELEERRRSLGRVFDSLNVQASSVLVFTAQWKELEDHFKSVRKELRTRLEDLEKRVKLVAEVEARAKSETEAREKELGEREEAVEKKRREAEEGERELSSMKLLIEEYREVIRVNDSEFLEVEELVKERYRKLDWVEKRVEEKLNEVKVEERKLDVIRELIEVKREEVEECEGELEMKEERLMLVERSIVNCDRILDLKEKLISVLDSKAKDFALVEKSMEEWSCKLEGWVAKIEGKEEGVDRKIKELNLVHNKFIDEVELKERHLDSLVESLLERENDLLSLQDLCKGSEFTRDGKGLQKLVDENFKRIDFVGTEVSAILEECSDPAKLVLDAMQEFYPDQRELHFDLRVRRRGCCLLLKELKRISPQISPQVRQEATKLAADWKANMTMASDNDLEVLGFLRLVTTYDLASIYNAKELKSLLSTVSQGKQATDIGHALGIASPEFPHVTPPLKEDAMKLAFQWKAKMRADVENAWEILGFLNFIAAYELVHTLDIDEIVKLLGMISQNKEALEFCQTLPYADKIPGEFIHCLVERKQLMEAIEFICSFKLIKKFPPAPLLKEYVEEKMKCCRDGYTTEKINDGKVKVVDLHITDLRAVINLIKDYNLESEYPSSKVEMEISELEKVKEKWSKVQLNNVDKEQKKGTKRHSSTPRSKFEPQEQASKSHRTVATAPTPQPLQLYTPIYLQPYTSHYQLYPRQFGAIPNAGIPRGLSYPPNLPQWNPLPNFGRGFFP